MTGSQKTAILWLVAGAAFLVAGLVAEPSRPLAVVAGVLFVVVGILSIVRGRGAGGRS